MVVEYQLELERAKLPGYISRYDDAYEGQEQETALRARIETSGIPAPHLRKDSKGNESARADTNQDASSPRSDSH